MKPSNNISIKGTIYVNDRKKEVDGPWKPTLDDAILAFADMLTLNGWRKLIVFRPFVARKEHRSIAACCDSKGNYYSEVVTPDLRARLAAAHIELGPIVVSECCAPISEEDKDDWNEVDVVTAEGYATLAQHKNNPPVVTCEIRQNHTSSPDADVFSANLREVFYKSMV